MGRDEDKQKKQATIEKMVACFILRIARYVLVSHFAVNHVALSVGRRRGWPARRFRLRLSLGVELLA
jgi:hypothetical protein